MDPVRYLARIQATNMRVELRVNDVPVAILPPGAAVGGAEVPLNEFLVAGPNRAVAIAHANPLPSRFADPWGPQAEPGVQLGAPASLQVQIVRVGAGSAGFAPVQLGWNGAAQPAPASIDRSFNVDTPFPSWAWLRARELQGADAAAAYQALRALHDRLARNDAAGIATLMDLKLQEVATGAYRAPAGPLRAGLAQGLAQCMGNPAWTLLPVEPGQVDLRLVAGRRMAECLRPGGAHALTYVKANSRATFFLPVMLGMLEGRWQVLR